MREGWGEVSDLLDLRQGLGLENVSCLVSDGRKGKNAYAKSLPGAGFGVMGNQQFCLLSFVHSYLFFGVDSFCHGTRCHMERGGGGKGALRWKICEYGSHLWLRS